MATSASRRILQIETPTLNNLNPKQIGFETEGELSYFNTQGIWGGKNSFEGVSRFAGFDDVVRFKKVYFADQIITISIDGENDEESGSTTRVPYSMNMGKRSGLNATNPAINLGEDAGRYATNGVAINTGIHIGSFAGVQSNGVGTISLGGGSNYGLVGNYNASIGRDAGMQSSGAGNSTFGYAAGVQLKGNRNVSIGQDSGFYSIGDDSIFIGWGAGNTSVGAIIDTASQQGNNVCVGRGTGSFLSGSSNTFIGIDSGRNRTGDNSICVGRNAGIYSFGSDCVLLGDSAGYNISGSDNVCIGEDAGAYVIGTDNVVIGEGAGYRAIGSNSNIMVGQYVGEKTTNVTMSTFIGNKAGASATNSIDCIGIGESSSELSMGNNNVFIGTSAGYAVSANNKFELRNATNSLIVGDFSTKIINLQYLNLIPTATAPSTNAKGDMYMHTDGNLRVHNGTIWKTVAYV